MNSRMWFMQLRRWCSQFIQEGSPERGNVLGFGRWRFYLENIKFTQVGHSQVVGYIYLKLRKKNKAGRIYHKPSRHQCLGIQRWLLVQGTPSLPEETEGKWKECVQRWYHLGAIKTPKKGNRSMYCHQVLPWMKPPLRGEETLKGRSWDPEYYQHVRVEQMKNSLQEDFISVAEDRERKLEECGNVKAKRRDSSGGRQATERWSEIRIETKAKWKMFSVDSSRCGRSTEESHLNQPARTGRFPEGGGSWDKEWVTRVN